MLNFEKELEKFKPLLEVDYIEEQIITEDIRDIIDLIKEGVQDKAIRFKDKE